MLPSLQNNTTLFNIYGATEVSSWQTCYQITSEDLLSAKQCPDVPIGEPLLGTMVDLRDSGGTAVDLSDNQGSTVDQQDIEGSTVDQQDIEGSTVDQQGIGGSTADQQDIEGSTVDQEGIGGSAGSQGSGEIWIGKETQLVAKHTRRTMSFLAPHNEGKLSSRGQ